MKSVITHVGLLAVSGVLAFTVWSRDEKAEKEKPDMVEVWSGSADTVESVSFDGMKRKVRLAARRDNLGRWYTVSVDKEEESTPPAHPPSGDAGAPPASTPPKHELSSFIGAKEADEIVKKLANLKAVRSLGKFDAARAADYGLDKPEATLKVKLGGREQVLTIGGTTPGGGERYAKYGASGEVFAVDSDLIQALSYAESRLMSRDMHSFADEDVKRVRISRGAKSREIVRVPDKKDAWADAATPTKADETVVNWMTKLDRVRPFQYVEKPEPAPRPDQLTVRVDYLSGSKNLGFFELYKMGADKGSDYLARTESSRWYFKIVAGVADQLEQDVGTVLK
jgi:hypothetical protein